MKKLLLMFVACSIILSPLFAVPQTDADIAYTQEYIAAMQKAPGKARIAAFQTYIKKFPNTAGEKGKYSRLAYYWITMDQFTLKNYSATVKSGAKALTLKGFQPGEEARLNLVVANSHAIKSSPVFDKDKALKYTNKAIALAKTNQLKDVLKTANGLKTKLTTPPPPSETPVQKLMRFTYQDEDFDSAIAQYRKMKAADKNSEDAKKAYGTALFKGEKYDSALKFYQGLFSTSKSGVAAFRIAKSYEAKAQRNRKLYQKAAEYFAYASVLYQKEGKGSNAKASKTYVKNSIVSKHNLQRRIDKYNRSQSKGASSAKKNQAAIANMKKKIRRAKYNIRKKYRGMGTDIPEWEYNKVRKMEKELANLQAGGAPSGGGNATEAKAINELLKKVDAEVKALMSKAKASV